MAEEGPVAPVGLAAGVEGPEVGRVLGTADATPLSFWVAVASDAYLQLDDVVVTQRQLPDQPPVTIAGVVTAVRARHEGAHVVGRSAAIGSILGRASTASARSCG